MFSQNIPDMSTLTPSQNNVMRVNLGSTFQTSQSANRTTGYQWNVEVSPGLQIVDSNYRIECPSQTQMVGCGGVTTWTIKANQRGQQYIKGTYKRPWESSIEKTFNITVIVS